MTCHCGYSDIYWKHVDGFVVCPTCALVYFVDDSPKRGTRKAYGQAGLVRLTDKEHESLVETYGDAQTAAIIERLDSYKLAKGKKYRSDMGAIRQWVIESVGAVPVEKPKAYKAITLGIA